jgi:hypothetical protein
MALENVLEQIRARMEDSIKQRLSGLQGFVVTPVYNSMMPLHVQVSLAPQLYDFVFLKDGVVELRRGSGSVADLRIESDAQTFTSLFRNPSTILFNELESQRMIRVISLTKKGKDAEGYIRRYLAG